MNNIVLFGFMGCGKSTVGALLAQKSGRPLLDTDGYLEQKYGRTIPQIFATDGEEAFRQMERQVCRELAGRTGLVLCCGGGTVLNGENADFLAQSGTMVFLDAPLWSATTGFGRATDRWYKKTAKRKYSGFLSFGARYTCPGHR